MKKDRTQQRTGSRTGSRDTREDKRYGYKKDGTPDKRYGKRSALERAYAPKSAKPARPEKEGRGGRTSRAESFERPELSPNLIIGRNPVMEAIKSGRTIDKVMVQKDAEGSIGKIISLAREKKIQVQNVDKIALDKLAPGRPHQGVAAFAAAKDYTPVSMVLQDARAKGEDPLFVILDGLEDPHNLGAVLRSCDGAGAHGVVIPSRRAVGLTETVAKASAGAIEYVPVSRVTNLASTVDSLKEQGVWIAAVDMNGTPYTEADLTGPLALIIGAEGSGVSKLLREKADYIISIPMKGHVNSLNASNAAAIVLYEAVRQRGLKEK
ncbi:MAG: 23S rRNA (guanosine(2251)-2'-O)-methyltransferase RlmB [Firmicutes bacterium]|nr:23S rRNA (guanosine(2251)-2'-O)-methyltransferase RlmB [Bacillota bacterium]